MPKKVPKKTLANPHGLTYKQDMVVRDVIAKVEQGKGLKVVNSVEKFYNVKNHATAKQIAIDNMRNQNFRDALIAGLTEKKILGIDSVTESKLIEGLDATDRGEPDYDARLKYIQEIHKVAGVYAPEIRKTMNLNVDMTEDELDSHIKKLQEELE